MINFLDFKVTRFISAIILLFIASCVPQRPILPMQATAVNIVSGLPETTAKLDEQCRRVGTTQTFRDKYHLLLFGAGLGAQFAQILQYDPYIVRFYQCPEMKTYFAVGIQEITLALNRQCKPIGLETLPKNQVEITLYATVAGANVAQILYERNSTYDVRFWQCHADSINALAEKKGILDVGEVAPLKVEDMAFASVCESLNADAHSDQEVKTYGESVKNHAVIWSGNVNSIRKNSGRKFQVLVYNQRVNADTGCKIILSGLGKKIDDISEGRDIIFSGTIIDYSPGKTGSSAMITLDDVQIVSVQ